MGQLALTVILCLSTKDEQIRKTLNRIWKSCNLITFFSIEDQNVMPLAKEEGSVVFSVADVFANSCWFSQKRTLSSHARQENMPHVSNLTTYTFQQLFIVLVWLLSLCSLQIESWHSSWQPFFDFFSSWCPCTSKCRDLDFHIWSCSVVYLSFCVRFGCHFRGERTSAKYKRSIMQIWKK